MWSKVSQSQCHGIVICSFQNTDVPDALKLLVCDKVVILEKCEGWYRGYRLENKQVKGIFPCSYVHIETATRVSSCIQEQENELMVMSEVIPVAEELTETIKEWVKAVKKLYVEPSAGKNIQQRQVLLRSMLDKEIPYLLKLRQEIMSPFFSKHYRHKLRIEIAKKIDWGNKHLKLDVTPRKDGFPINPRDLCPVELYQLHQPVTLARQQSTREVAEISHHMYMRLHSCTISQLSDILIYFFLYDAQRSQYLTERVLCRIDNKNLGEGNTKVFDRKDFAFKFVDLTTQDISGDTYLVAQVYRKGSLNPKPNEKGNVLFKKPYGCAALHVQKILCTLGDKQVSMGTAYVREYNMVISVVKEEEEFDSLFRSLISRGNGRISQEEKTNSLCLEIESLQQEGQSNSFNRRSDIVERIGLPEVLPPGIVRNDLFVVLNGATFRQGNMRAPYNLEAKLSVVGENGQALEYCVFGASGMSCQSSYNDLSVFYHCNKPIWNEVIKLQIPVDTFHKCHLRIEYRHCSTNAAEKSLIGFSFLPLEDKREMTLHDGTHELLIYKLQYLRDKDSKNSDINMLTNADAQRYLTLPYKKEDLTSQQQNEFHVHTDQSTKLTSQLCATLLTQNEHLLRVYEWKKYKNLLSKILQDTNLISDIELMRHHSRYMDSLFGMMAQCQQFSGQIFKALVQLLECSKRYPSFTRLIDHYLDKRFSSITAHMDMIQVMSSQLSNNDPEEDLELTFSNIDSLFKFIIKSAQVHKKQACGTQQPYQTLKVGMEAFWESVEIFLRNTSVINMDALACKLINRLVDIFPQLMAVFTADEIASSYVSVLSKLPKRNSELGTLKLNCLAKAVKSKLFNSEDARGSLVHLCTEQLHGLLDKDDDLQLITNVLSDLLLAMHTYKVSRSNIEQVTMKLLPSVMKKIVTEFTESRVFPSGQLITAMATMLSAMDDTMFNQMLSQCNTDLDSMYEYLEITIEAFRLSQQLIPKDWSAVHLVTAKAALDKSLALFEFMKSVVNTAEWGEEADENMRLWLLLFYFMIEFIKLPALQLELFGELKRKIIENSFGDMRLQMANILVKTWASFEKNSRFIGSRFLDAIFEISLVPDVALRQKVIPLIFDLFAYDENEAGQLEMQLVVLLDRQFQQQNSGDAEYQTLFRSILLAHTSDNPAVTERVVKFVDASVKLMDRLLDHRAVTQNRHSNAIVLMLSLYNLAEFYENDIKCPELFALYIDTLTELHIEREQYTEAGLLILLDAQRYDWSEQLVVVTSHSSMKSWEKKEEMYLKAITLLDKGQSWEKAIDLCKELAEFYEHILVDYERMLSLTSLQGVLCRRITEELRIGRLYFRVAFYGGALPDCIRNKAFIYRGGPFEQLADVMKMLKKEQPDAELLNSPIDVPDDSLLHQAKSYYQVVATTPVVNRSSVKPLAIGQPKLKYTKYFLTNNVQEFAYLKSYHQGVKDKENEHKTLHYMRASFRTARPLPGISNWMEIISTERTTLKPIECAIDTVTKKVQDLRDICQKYREEPGCNINELSQAMAGTVDAAVGGGISKYEEAFLTSDYIETHEDDQHLISLLKSLITDLLKVLREGMELFGQRVQDIVTMIPLYENLVKTYNRLCDNMNEIVEFDISQLVILDSIFNLSEVNQEIPEVTERSSGHSNFEGESGLIDFGRIVTLSGSVSNLSEASDTSSPQKTTLKKKFKSSLKGLPLVRHQSENQLKATANQMRKKSEPTTPGSSKSRLSNISTASSEDSDLMTGLPSQQTSLKNRSRAITVSNFDFTRPKGRYSKVVSNRLPVCNEMDPQVTSPSYERRPSLPDFLMKSKDSSPSLIRKQKPFNKSPRSSSVRFQADHD